MQLNYKTYGQGPPLIILHGLFGMLDNWQTLAKKWAEHYTVFLIDQRNHGRSPHLDEHSNLLMAEDLHSFMDANWIHHARIMGHSMGGKAAMQFAVLYPDMVEQLVVVDIAPKDYPGGHQEIISALNGLDLQNLKDRKDADAKLSEDIDNFGIRQFLLKNLTREKTGGYRWKMNLQTLTKNYPLVLKNIEKSETYDGSVLFIKGANSSYIEKGDLDTIKNYFPNAELKSVPNAGHWVHAQQPDILYQLVSDFLSKGAN